MVIFEINFFLKKDLSTALATFLDMGHNVYQINLVQIMNYVRYHAKLPFFQ